MMEIIRIFDEEVEGVKGGVRGGWEVNKEVKDEAEEEGVPVEVTAWRWKRVDGDNEEVAERNEMQTMGEWRRRLMRIK